MAGGRPIELDALKANQIVAILQRGLPITDACEAAKVSESTYHRWMRRGETAFKKKTRTVEEERFCQFWEGVKGARATGKVSLLDLIETAAKGRGVESPADWKAAAWLLERMYPHQFGRKYIRIEGGGPEMDQPGTTPGAAPVPVKVVFEVSGQAPTHPPIVDEGE